MNAGLPGAVFVTACILQTLHRLVQEVVLKAEGPHQSRQTDGIGALSSVQEGELVQ
jgi:hypothetical protein